MVQRTDTAFDFKKNSLLLIFNSYNFRSQSPYNNGIDNCSEVDFGDFDDDDADSTFNPEDFLPEPKKKVKTRNSFKRPKVWHPCDQCNARYSSLGKLI